MIVEEVSTVCVGGRASHLIPVFTQQSNRHAKQRRFLGIKDAVPIGIDVHAAGKRRAEQFAKVVLDARLPLFQDDGP